MSLVLAFGFFTVAFVYSMAGFGGGSSYTALLTFTNLGTLIPVLSLSCNIVVSSQGTLQLIHGGHLPWRRMLPLVLVSVPAAYTAGSLPISVPVLKAVLAPALLVSGILMVIRLPQSTEPRHVSPVAETTRSALLGLSLGALAGITGIGGGIFLAPLLHLLHWAKPVQIAATASCFILLNSIAGLAGQLGKHAHVLEQLQSYWMLPLVVFAGGLIGSRLTTKKLPQRAIRRLTGALVILAAIRLGANLSF